VRTTLDNGLRVVIVEDHSAPVVALNVWVRTGSADETETEAGMAHVFEHMLFKGTERRAVGEIARTVEAAGGNINAFTSFDMTVYHITMASRDADVGIEVLVDAALHSTFDPEELSKEREVVVEEIRRGEDSPGRVLFQAVYSKAYQVHPYRLPVIGTMESVRSFTREQLLDFHRLRTAFAETAPRAAPQHGREAEPPQTAPRAEVVRREFSQPMLGLAFRGTEFSHPDTPHLDLLSMVLGGGETSRLYRNVKDRQRLVHTIGAGAYTPLDPGLFFVDASLDGERIEETLGAIAREIELLQDFGPSEIELERARANVLASEIREKETMQGQSRKLGYFETLGGGIEKEQEYLDAIRASTIEDVMRVARTYLVPETMTAVMLLPEEERTDVDSDALISAYRAGLDRTHELVGEPIHDEIWRYRLPNGLRVIVKRNPNVALVAMRLSFLGGLLAETDETQGLSSFLAEMLERGTEQRSAAQIAAEVEGIAGGLGGFSGRNSFGVTGNFLSESLDTGLELFADLVLHPSFPETEIEKLRTETLAALVRREDNLAGKAFDLFAETLYDGHPYRYPVMGEPETVEQFDRAALTGYYERYAVPENGVLSIVGDVDPDDVVQAVASHFAEWRSSGDGKLPDRVIPPAPSKPVRAEIEKNRQQTHIVYGFPGIALGDPDLPSLEVLTQILAGQGGRLFLELRDQQSLAYSVTAHSIEGVDPGSFLVYIACAPEKLDEALEGIESELRRILEEPIDPEELERSRGYLVGTQAVSLQRYGNQARLLSLNELYGLGAIHYLDYAERIEAVTLDDVKRVAQRIIDLDAPIVAVVR
jgi:zinc protease